MTESTFAKRLATACEQNRDIPGYGLGRQTWVKEKMGVSHEAVRKWFTGESRPRPNKMAELATILGVDEAWLALGIKPAMKPKEVRAWNTRAEGAVNVFTGLLQMGGAHCAFPREDDPAADFVSIYAIARGVQTSYHVTLAQPGADGVLRVTIPLEYERCVVVVAVQVGRLQLEFFRVPQEVIEERAERKGGYRALDVQSHGGGVYSAGQYRFDADEPLPAQ